MTTRLATPGMWWVVVGASLLIGAVAVLILAEPGSVLELGGSEAPVLDLATWVGGLVACGMGVAGVIAGLFLQARLDRAERQELPEPLPRPVAHAAVVAAWLGFGAVALLMAVGLSIAHGVFADVGDIDLIGVPVLSGALSLVGMISTMVGLLWGLRGDQSPPPSLPPPSDPSVGRRWPISNLGAAVLVLVALLAVALQLTLVRWFIEDAAITFAYAKHLAAGEGLVTYPGGERVEGYSNPLWTFLIAAFYLVGIDGFISSKVLGVLCGGLAIPVTWLLAREARPHRVDGAPWVAVLVVATSAQMVIWTASGLENGLLNLLVALAIWRTLVEARRGGIPWSAALYFLVAITRPEAILYAALGGLAAMIFRFERVVPEILSAGSSSDRRSALWRGVWPTLAWLGLFFAPFLAYHAWRYDYFGWLAPNTYYAKKANPTKRFSPYDWHRGGWKYIKDYSYQLWQVFLLPVYLIGLLGARGVRLAVAALALLCVAVVVALPGTGLLAIDGFEDPSWWDTMRSWALLAAVVVPIPFAAGRPGSRALVLCWGTTVIALFFALYAGGDWMAGFRWMSSLVVPAAVVLAVGVAELAELLGRWVDRLSPWPGVLVALLLALLTLWLGLAILDTPFGLVMPWRWRFGEPELALLLASPVVLILAVLSGLFGGRSRRAALRWGPLARVWVVLALGVVLLPAAHSLHRHIQRPVTSPYKVKKRVDYMHAAQERLHLQGRPVTLDVDMGANMYWSGHEIVDVAGLVDVSMGHHWFERPFMREYILEERRPHFAHVHGNWATASKLPTIPRWDRDYLEIPGYPAGRRALHIGNHIRKDLLAVPEWHGTEGRAVQLAGGVRIEGWEVPAPTAVPGRDLFLEVALRTTRDRERWEGLRVIGFLSGADGVLVSWDLPPGYDWYTPSEWSSDEVVFGRYSVPVPADAPHGSYDLGLVVMGTQQGDVLRALGSPEGVTVGGEGTSRLARGEVRWTDVVRIVGADEVEELSEADVQRSVELASQGACAEAETLFWTADRRMTRTGWVDRRRVDVAAPLARCWAGVASPDKPVQAQVDAIVRARSWDHHEPSVIAAGARLAGELEPVGDAAAAEADWETAYPAYRDVMRVAPWRSRVRGKAEEARDCRLRIRGRSCLDVPPEPRIDADLEDTGDELFELEPQDPDDGVEPVDELPGTMPLAVPVDGDGGQR